jgi:hypothetical protein
MEVHHHPHAPHSKKFKEYFLEFLMIFLAVTLGFFAESLREHITEKRKEREYIRGIVSDLKTDTVKLSRVIKYYNKMIPLMDSGRKNFYKLQQPGSLNTVAIIQFSMAGFQDFIYTDISLQQIKAAGGMSLIKKKAAVDSILSYDAKVKVALINEKVLGDLLISTQHEMGGILNMQPLLESIGRETDPVKKKAAADSINKTKHGFLLTHDPVVMGQFYNDYTYYFSISTMAKLEMQELRKMAGSVIVFLKKEYEVEDE